MAAHDEDILASDGEPFGFRALARLGLWGTLAICALGVAVLSGRSDIGAKRAHSAILAMTAVPSTEPLPAATAQVATRPAEAEREARRLIDAVRVLANDRDRLASRVGSIERALGDLTGSVNRSAAADGRAAEAKLQQDVPPTAVPAAPGPLASVAAPPPATTAEASPRAGVSVPAPHAPAANPMVIPLPRPAPPGLSSRTGEAAIEYAVDLGAGVTIARLRERWTALNATHGTLFGNLRPLVALRETPRNGAVEMRLVAGPLPNVGAASQLCSALAGTSFSCQPSVFDGQRLAQR